MFAPVKVPAPILQRLNQTMREVLDEPEVKAALFKQGIEAESSSSEAMAKILQTDINVFRDAVIRAGITFSKEKP